MYALQKIGGFCICTSARKRWRVGRLSTLRPDDLIITAYREHVHALVKGCDAGRVMAELFGRRDGVSRGKGGSMHLSTGRRHARRPREIVGGHIPLATGTAFAAKYQKKDVVTLCFFGEAPRSTSAHSTSR